LPRREKGGVRDGNAMNGRMPFAPTIDGGMIRGWGLLHSDMHGVREFDL